MKKIIFLCFLLTIFGCYVRKISYLNEEQQIRLRFYLGSDDCHTISGLWYKWKVYEEPDPNSDDPYIRRGDVRWALEQENPTHICDNENFILSARITHSENKFVIIKINNEKLEYNYGPMDNIKFKALRIKLGIPDSLILKPINDN